jgi:hypothetical protein
MFLARYPGRVPPPGDLSAGAGLPRAAGPEPLRLEGSLWAFVLFDVAEEIHLDRLRHMQPSNAAREPRFRHLAPDYVRFEHPPVAESLPPVRLSTGEVCNLRIKYFDYGVISLEFELPFSTTLDDLVARTQRLAGKEDLEAMGAEIARERIAQAGPALKNVYPQWLAEDYLVIQISSVQGESLTGAELMSRYGGPISQLVRGEALPLSPGEQAEVLGASLSYYPSDLLVVSWSAALIYDTPEAAAPTLQLFEYANTQLLEFRHYDETLRRLLAELYQVLERRGGLLRRWHTAREAARLNTIRLDVLELADRSENAIRFLSDTFYARVYRLAAARIGVNDYRALTDQKLRLADELYQFIVNEFHQGRAFVLESMIVAILIIDLFFLFRNL